jgi:DNA-directed RNA polymerase subunit RPC12/RpoP
VRPLRSRDGVEDDDAPACGWCPADASTTVLYATAVRWRPLGSSQWRPSFACSSCRSRLRVELRTPVCGCDEVLVAPASVVVPDEGVTLHLATCRRCTSSRVVEVRPKRSTAPLQGSLFAVEAVAHG